MWTVRKGLLWTSERLSCWNVLEQLAYYVPTSSDILSNIRDMSHVKYVIYTVLLPLLELVLIMVIEKSCSHC